MLMLMLSIDHSIELCIFCSLPPEGGFNWTIRLGFHILHACIPGQLQLKKIYSLNISILCISSNHGFWWPHYVQPFYQIVHMTYLCFHFASMSPKENATTSSTPSDKILYAFMDAYSLSQSSHSIVMRWSIKRKQLRA